MATSLLISCSSPAAFKTLSLQASRIRRLPSALYLCTKPVDSKKNSQKKAKPLTETAEEIHDISTYKNLQHHEYQPFTFVDYDVLLSKFRLPQPSSGRLSPRH